MSAEFCYTDEPHYILKKEYEEKPDINKLFEIFVIVYKAELPKYKVSKEEDTARYLFFHDLEKALKRWKLFGPRGALLQRIFTDDEELNELASKNDNIVVENVSEDEEEAKEETKQDIEV
jgi:hypothetical protein